jgi:hypothetical protein
MSLRLSVAAALAGVAVCFSSAAAWGPHTEITRAAQSVVPDAERLQKTYGDDWDRIARDYCWMGDWREAVRPDHYADDYLLFPAAPGHFSHMPPEVRKTFEPFFRRALQAIRTESPRNAARWIGSLLHFVQDAGSPPHAANVGGETHGKMERWVDEAKISIEGYRPKLFGKTDDEALRRFLERMDRLHDYSRTRGDKLRPLVEGLKDRVNQPLELECALETARVSADLLHTLFSLGEKKPAGGTLRGKLEVRSPAGYAAVPAKVMLAGTLYSTTTGDEGDFCLHNLPPGKYRVLLLATGYEFEERDVEIATGRETVGDWKLKADAIRGNLVRNPAFAAQWVRAKHLDFWSRDPVRRGRWASGLIRVPVDRRCAVRVEFQPGQSAAVSVRWRTDPSKAEGREVKIDAGKGEVSPDPLSKPFEKGFLFLELLIETDKPLVDVCRHAAVAFVEGKD